MEWWQNALRLNKIANWWHYIPKINRRAEHTPDFTCQGIWHRYFSKHAWSLFGAWMCTCRGKSRNFSKGFWEAPRPYPWTNKIRHRPCIHPFSLLSPQPSTALPAHLRSAATLAHSVRPSSSVFGLKMRTIPGFGSCAMHLEKYDSGWSILISLFLLYSELVWST